MYSRYLKLSFGRQPIRGPDAHLGAKGVTVIQDRVSTFALFTLKDDEPSSLFTHHSSAVVLNDSEVGCCVSIHDSLSAFLPQRRMK